MASPYPSAQTARDQSGTGAQDRVTFDNLLRRELKVADPSDAKQVAQALIARYKNDPRTQAMDQEARGLPFAMAPSYQALAPSAPIASDGEWLQANDDVERDLKELTNSVELKDTSLELAGWTQGIRSALSEGIAAARYGLDPRQRDKVFGIRAQLRDYARLARLLGALTQASNGPYRQLARSLDETSGVLLVRLGESLATSGYGGRFLLQAPFSELQVRRDACIYSLRSLTGSAQEAYGQNEWPRGLDAYRRLFQLLEEQGQGDLRSLLVENELSRIMDDLIQRTSQGTPEGLRAVGATAQIDLARFRRLVLIGRASVNPSSPALASFLEALQLFVDAFTAAGGSRLLRIARPPILLYGLYGAQGVTLADRRLIDLITVRTALAELADCFMDCTCTNEDVERQVILDKSLYSLDRAVDLYALGRNEFESPECRASAHAYVLLAAWGQLQLGADLAGNNFEATQNRVGILDLLLQGVRALAPLLPAAGWAPLSPPFMAHRNILLREQELALQRQIEISWGPMLLGMSTGCIRLEAIFAESGVTPVAKDFIKIKKDGNDDQVKAAGLRVIGSGGALGTLNQSAIFINRHRPLVLPAPPAPADPDPTAALREFLGIGHGIHHFHDDPIRIPPHFETSLNELVNNTDELDQHAGDA
jgi:hypothetical protein